MDTKEFFNKYDGNKIDFDGSFGAQCVDLYRQYCKEFLQIPQSPGVIGAYQIWDNYLQQYFDKIYNTPLAIPILGDIIIWSKGLGEYGHVSIFYEGNILSFTSFDQNFPVGSACHFQKHNYKYILGWLRFKRLMVDKEKFKEEIIEFIRSL